MRELSRTIAGGMVLAIAAQSLGACGVEDRPPELGDASETASPRIARMEQDSRGRAELLQLEQGAAFAISIDERGLPKRLSGRDLLSERCSALLGEDLESTGVLRAARCFFAENRALYPGDGEYSYLQVEQIAEGESKDELLVELRHYWQGLPVRPGNVKLSFAGRELRSVAGALLDPREFRGVEKTGAAQYYDAKRRIFAKVEEKGVLRRVIDVETGAVVEETDRRAWEQRPVNSHDYPTGLSRTGPTAKNTEINVLTLFGTWHRLERTGSGYVRETSYEPDRTGDTCPNRFVASISAPPSANPWATMPVTDYRFNAANAYYWMNAAADYRTHWSAGFGYSQNDVPLELVVTKCADDAAGWYFPVGGGAHGEIGLGAGGPENPDGALRLATIVHEYGHYIHDRYGFHGARSVKEGFADTMPQRWALYANEFRGEWPGLNYDNNDVAALIKHQDTLRNGEMHIGPLPNGDDLYYPDDACSADENGGDPYTCGRVIEAVYWELAWDTCRLSYGLNQGGCNFGGDVIQTGVYANTARRLANAAFATGLAFMTESTPKVGDFFDSVELYYANAQLAGTISSADLERVRNVLAHHCVGSLEHCSDGTHRLPQSRLPSNATVKKLFVESENAMRSGSASVFNSSNAAGGRFVRLSGPPASLVASFNVQSGDTGTYGARLVARKLLFSPTPTFRVRINGGPWTAAISVPDTAWAWKGNFAQTFLGAGNATIEIEVVGGPLDIDAIVLQKI